MKYPVVMFKVRNNSSPRIDFTCMLKCTCDRAPFLTKSEYMYFLCFRAISVLGSRRIPHFMATSRSKGSKGIC